MLVVHVLLLKKVMILELLPLRWKLKNVEILFFPNLHLVKDLSRVKCSFKKVPPQFYFEIARLASAVKWREIQNIDEEECF